MRKNLKWTDDLKRKAINMIAKGYYSTDVAKRLNLDPERVKRMFIRWKAAENAKTMPQLIHILHLNGYFNDRVS